MGGQGRREAVDLVVRRAMVADAPAIHEAHLRAIEHCYPAAYPPEVVEALSSRQSPEQHLPAIERGEVSVALVEGRVVGFVHAVPGRIVGLYVHPDYQRRGVGSALLREGEATALGGGQEGVLVRSSLPAMPFYQRHGYLPLQREELALQCGLRVACVVMVKCPRAPKP